MFNHWGAAAGLPAFHTKPAGVPLRNDNDGHNSCRTTQSLTEEHNAPPLRTSTPMLTCGTCRSRYCLLWHTLHGMRKFKATRHHWKHNTCHNNILSQQQLKLAASSGRQLYSSACLPATHMVRVRGGVGRRDYGVGDTDVGYAVGWQMSP
jgi:hypothetical protein